MQENTINVKIANRAYPITAAPGDDETLRKASQMVNQMLDQLKNNYAVRDLQDLLAMCCLELAHYKVRGTDTNTGEPQQQQPAANVADITGELGELERRIAEYLAG